MILSQRQVNHVISYIEAHPQFQQILDIARKNSYAPFYFVGGQVYRNLAKVLHSGDRGVSSCDWDILVMGKPRADYLPPRILNSRSHWRWMKSSSYSTFDYSYKAEYILTQKKKKGFLNQIGPKQLFKVDIISIDDMVGPKEDASLANYFSKVPLDVQAIALDYRARTIVGPGIDAVNRKIVSINNAQGTMPGLDAHSLMIEKSDTLNFSFTGMNSSGKCSCTHSFLAQGCTCGGK